MSLVERTVDIAIEALNILVDKAPGFHAWEKDVARPSLQNKELVLPILWTSYVPKVLYMYSMMEAYYF